MTIDTLKISQRLRQAGFTEPQAEAVVEAVREGADDADLATKQDLRLLSTELRAEIAAVRADLSAEIAAVRADLSAEIAAVRAEMREMEQRLNARIEAAAAALMNRVVGMILGTVLVNVVTILGAMFAAVKLLGH